MISIRKILILGLVIISVLVSGCSAQNTGTKAPPSPSTSGSGIKKDIEISGFAFNPSELTINKGDTVIWTNKDSASHTVSSDSGSELGSGMLSNGQAYSHTFDSAGTFEYHCSVHPSMKAKIIVR